MYNIIKYGKDKFSNYTEILAKDSYIKLLESSIYQLYWGLSALKGVFL